jgi:aspartate/glutamate racemase
MKYSAEQIDLGVLGGMGPRATHYFIGELLRAVETRHHPARDQDYPNIVVRYAAYLPDRMAALETNPEPLADALRRECQILVELGCRSIIMPCISSHGMADRYLSSFPLADIRRTVAAFLERTTSAARIGILATRGARISGVLGKLIPADRELMLLTPEGEAQLMSFIFTEAKTWRGGDSSTILFDLIADFHRRGCDLVIAACTEVEMCLGHDGRWMEGVVFPLRIAAEAFAAGWRPPKPPLSVNLQRDDSGP